jgi:hypothetical protein
VRLIDLERLLRLRLVVARYGELDGARWWGTEGVLGRHGALLMSRSFPRTYRFAQARLAFAVATARCTEIYSPPTGYSLWRLPPEIEDDFDTRWPGWARDSERWHELFDGLHEPPADLLEALGARGLLSPQTRERVATLRRAAEGRTVTLPNVDTLDNATVELLAAAFSRSEPGKLAVPYVSVGSA